MLSNDPAELTQRGTEALTAGRFDDALAAFERAVELEPENARYALNSAVAYRAVRRQAMSIWVAHRIMTMPTADRELQIEAATLAGSTIWQCIDERISGCIKDPLLTTAEIERLDKQGQDLVQAKRSGEALPIFLRAYAFSGNPRPLLRIATFEYVTGHYKDALAHARRVSETVPEKSSDLHKETEELIRAIEAGCRQAKANCTSK